MASLSQCRALAGCRAFTQARPSAKKVNISNGSKYFMRRKDSYMVEVQVGEEEPEDIAVRRFMKQVVSSRVIEKLRSRRHKETKIEEAKRRLRERIEMRKNKIFEPTWEEAYGDNNDNPFPFDEFFNRDPDDDFFSDLPMGPSEGDSFFSADSDGKWGSYIDTTSQQRGGYLGNYQPGYQQGGYMNQQGGYINQQGGYINPNGGYMQ